MIFSDKKKVYYFTKYRIHKNLHLFHLFVSLYKFMFLFIGHSLFSKCFSAKRNLIKKLELTEFFLIRVKINAFFYTRKTKQKITLINY